jgi:YidC/Oxa1 family membrane protein insertase
LPDVEPTPVPITQPVALDTPAPTATAVQTLPWKACGLDAVVTTDGGGLTAVKLPLYEGPYDIEPLYMYVYSAILGDGGDWSPYPETPSIEQVMSDSALGLAAGTGNPATYRQRFEVQSSDDQTIEMRGIDRDGVEIRTVYSAGHDDPCIFDVSVTWTNNGATTVDSDLWVGMHDQVPTVAGYLDMYKNQARVFAHVDGDLEYGAWTETDEGAAHEPEVVEGPAHWIGIADRFFGVLALPSDKTSQAYWSQRGVGEDVLAGVHWVAASGLEPGASHSASLQVYAGPLDTNALATVDPALVDIIDFGMFAVFAYPLLFALRGLEGVIGNWGLAIIVLTVGVKLAFFPLTNMAFKSGEAMKAIQPLMNEIKEKYADDQQKQQAETMALFKEHGVNPLGGCLPMLVQMPVFLALFYVLMYSADLYHTDFLYLKDLSSPDPYCILPTVVVALMLIQQQFTVTGNMDPAQARMMKLMPLMFGVFWFMFPSGLVVYYFVNTALGVLQQWWIRRTFQSPPSSATPEPVAA